MDGRTRRVTLYLPRRNPRLESAEGKVLSVEDATEVKRLTGVDEVLSTDETRSDWLGKLPNGMPREISLIRKASQIAGRGLMEAIRSTAPGLYEFQLDAAARYVFLASGARLEGYRSITASGTANIRNMHYYRNMGPLNDGNLVLMDYAPEYGYYTSDIARMWPVSGKYSARQRELLQFVLEYRNAVMKRIRPGAARGRLWTKLRSPWNQFSRARNSPLPLTSRPLAGWSKPEEVCFRILSG